MRIYGTQTIPASIKQKNDIGTKYGKGSRQLTAEDFEIVPEHEEEQLVDVRCDICGVKAEYFDPDITPGESESSLVSLQMYVGTKKPNKRDDVTAEFIEEVWYEVCEPCLQQTVVPALKSLRHLSAPVSVAPQADEEPALREGPANPLHPHGLPRGTLIGDEQEQGQLPPLPPLADDEPF